MNRPPPIRAIGVVVPARNEQDRIGPCLRALSASLEELPPEALCGVCVVLDRCTDPTGAAARRAMPRPGRVAVDLITNSAPTEIGEIRDRGIRRLLGLLADVPRRQIWLLNTDADSAVPPHWARDHIRHADSGADAVAGTVSLDEPSGLDPVVLRRYTDLVHAGVRGDEHDHAYAANLGLRASAYTAVGGFPFVATGEDHELLARLETNGYRIDRPARLTVRTSSRLHGRALDGLSALLARMDADRLVELQP